MGDLPIRAACHGTDVGIDLRLGLLGVVERALGHSATTNHEVYEQGEQRKDEQVQLRHAGCCQVPDPSPRDTSSAPNTKYRTATSAPLCRASQALASSSR